MNYQRDGNAISVAVQLESGTSVVYRARNLARRSTGLHALLSISGSADGPETLLKSTYDNVDRDEPRVRLSNAAHKLLGAASQACYPVERLRHDLDLFCTGLWDAFTGSFAVESCVPPAVDVDPLFLLEPYLVRGAGTILFGPPKGGKSYTCLAMAQAVNHGVNNIWHTQPSTAMYVNLERPRGELLARLGRVNLALGLPRSSKMLMLHARGRTLSDVVTRMELGIAEHAVDLVVLDSISRAGMGTMVEDETANAIMDTLNALGITWLAIGHTPYSSEDKVFGSRMFMAAADIMVKTSFQRQGSTLGVSLTVTDANDLPEHAQQIIALDFNGYHLATIRKAKALEFPDLLGKRKITLTDEIDAFILGQSDRKATATEIAKATGHHRSNVSTLLNDRNKYVPFKEGREVSYGLRTDHDS